MVGRDIGNYRVTGVIGEGGMGTVYSAEHKAIGRKAAIKVLLPEMSASRSIVQRFFNEARATTSIRHPGIVDVFDYGQLEDGRAYIAMEQLEGENLAACLRRTGQLALGHIVAIGRQAASALAAAHEKGIVHRDLKPDNIFLVPDADLPGGVRVKILDFGIAKLATRGDAGLKTRTGAMMGTPVYMSPEQCRGASEVDCRSDIYSLGCVLFEVASGRPPFVRDGMGEVLAAHIYEPAPSLASVGVHASPGLEAILSRLLAKSPQDRIQTMSELRAELDSLDGPSASGPWLASIAAALPARASGAATTARSTTTLGGSSGQLGNPGPPHRRWALVAGGLAMALAAAALVTAVVQPRHGPRPERSAPPLPTAAPMAAPSSSLAVPANREGAAIEPPAQPAPPPARPHLRITSDPPGATVIRASDNQQLGTTPMDQVMDPTREAVKFIVAMPGRVSQEVFFNGNEDLSLAIRLMRPSQTAHPGGASVERSTVPAHTASAGSKKMGATPSRALEAGSAPAAPATPGPSPQPAAEPAASKPDPAIQDKDGRLKVF